ncbi:AAA family ATPase, partial [Mesorhizobium sp. LNHC229A00]|uniref:AAA family ATPase n=1 Tax=Mesorhizobium sp. LNHC229A00 TaxID=1287240 RepID=UPI00051862F0
NHPLSGISISIKNFKSFGEDAFPLLGFRPINILIGRNNSGKSSLIDLVDLFASGGKTYEQTKHNVGGRPFTAYLAHVVDEASIRRVFQESTLDEIDDAVAMFAPATLEALAQWMSAEDFKGVSTSRLPQGISISDEKKTVILERTSTLTLHRTVQQRS